MPEKHIAIIGSGPSGLVAAEYLSALGYKVTVYERKASVGRKFLMAGRGGLNLTHSEDLPVFTGRYGSRADVLGPLVEAFPPQALRAWCEGLGQKTFVGTSGRVFPESFKASPLLRAWLARLENQDVDFKLNHDWQGWDGDDLVFQTPEGRIAVQGDATLLALGGASWPRLGTDGSWVSILKDAGVSVAPLQAANCGFSVQWSDMFKAKFAGQPLKAVAVSLDGRVVTGDIMISDKGVEGGAIYALSSPLREAINQQGPMALTIDLKPDLDMAAVEQRLARPRGRDSVSSHLRRTLNLSPVAIGLLMENPDRASFGTYTPMRLAELVKNYALTLQAPFAIDRAISSAGGVMFQSVDQNLMLQNKPGVFVAGEMLDWEAPTGGYLLQGCFATGIQAAKGVVQYLGV